MSRLDSIFGNQVTIIGNPITIFDKYIKLLEDDGYFKHTNDKKSEKKLEKMMQHQMVKVFYVEEDNIKYCIDEQETSIRIYNGNNKYWRPDPVIVDCNDISADRLHKHVRSLLKKSNVDIQDSCILIIHPTESRIKIANRYFKCIPFEKIRSIIETLDVYSPYVCADEVFRDDTRDQFWDASRLSDFTTQNPLITVCCAEKEIEYPDFVHVDSSQDIKRKMTAVTINSDYEQTGPWKNVTTIKYIEKDVRRKRSKEPMPVNKDSIHICAFDYTGIDTLVIEGETKCDGDCIIDVPEIIFTNVKLAEISDFCKNNASIVRFDHECYAENGNELMKQALDIIRSMRYRKND